MKDWEFENEYANETVRALQAQLAERDKTILEQQARIGELRTVFTENMIRAYPTYTHSKINGHLTKDNLSALDAHDREVRIKTLGDAAEHFAHGFIKNNPAKDRVYISTVFKELRRMANES